MFLLDWYKQWLEIRSEFRAKKFELSREVKHEEVVCHSCETLRQQLEISNYEKDRLLNRLLEKPEAPPEPEKVPVTRPRMVPWNVRRQILEREDREKARSMANAAKPDSAKADVAALEREMDIASATREAEGQTGTK